MNINNAFMSRNAHKYENVPITPNWCWPITKIVLFVVNHVKFQLSAMFLKWRLCCKKAVCSFAVLIRSVVMSIQLLPKLFSSFQQFVATGHGPHWVTMWANRDLNMMELFFNNIVHFVESLCKEDVECNSLYSPLEEVQARLQFLSSVFSCELSQQDFSEFTMIM